MAPPRSDAGLELRRAIEAARDLDLGDAMEVETRENETQRSAKRIEVMSLRLAGLNDDQIAERVGVSQQAVSGMIQRHLERASNPLVEQLRGLENERLDRAQAAIWPAVLRGEIPAVRTFLSLSQRRATMNGLDAPKRVALSASVRVEMEQALADLNEVVLGEVIGEVIEDGPGTDPGDHRPTEASGEGGLI